MKFLMIVLNILTSSTAQIMLKQTSQQKNYSALWVLFLGISGILYLLSLVTYLIVLKYYPISKVMPVMTMGIIMLVVVFSMFIGERINLLQWIGIFLGMVSIYLIFSAS